MIPLGAQSLFFEQTEYPFPKPLVEVLGLPMIQRVIDNLSTLREPKRFIFILRAEDCTRYHLDSTIRLLAGDDCIILRTHAPTKGAACSALLAIDYLNNDDRLLIANGDQVFDTDLNACLDQFAQEEADAGCLTFESVHPRWSYVRLDTHGNVIETAEKHPISRHAIAGAYYFAKGRYFVQAAMDSIAKDAHVDGVFYIAPVLNELILRNLRLRAVPVPAGRYHTFYSPKLIDEYESRQRNQGIHA
jgi:NDP-sugar pyrophosphorylase family protein